MAAQDIGNWLNLIAFGGAELQTTFTSSGSLNPSPINQIVPFDTSDGAFTIGMSALATLGQKIQFVDVGLATSPTLTLTVSDPNGYEFQDPDNAETFTATYDFESPRNITWILIRNPATAVTFWAVP